MARRKRKRKKKSQGTRLRLVFGALVVAGLGYLTFQLTAFHFVQAQLVRYGVTDTFLPALRSHLDDVLSESFLDLGLLHNEVEERDLLEGESELRRYSFVTPPHLTPTQCHAYITKVVRAARSDVLLAEEDHHRHGEIRMRVGFGAITTHLVVMKRPSPKSRKPTTEQPAFRIALVIDDFGHSLDATAHSIFALGIPLTVAVLPDLAGSRQAFELARKHGVPTLLHLPMEPNRNLDPGKDPILQGMDRASIAGIVDGHLHNYGRSFVGINNHMGSKATADASTMRELMSVLKERDLFFFDSLTTPDSKAHRSARQAGVWSARNDLFLDDRTRSAKEVARNLRELARLAEEAPSKTAIGIAHARDYTLQALQAMVPRLAAEGYRFVTLADLQAETSERQAAKAPGR